MTSQLEQLSQREQRTHFEHTSALNDLKALRNTHSDLVVSHCKYLHTLFASLNVSRTKNGSSTDVSTDSELNWSPDRSKWEGLTGCVTTAVMALTEALKRTKKDVKLLKATNTSLVTTLQSADALYKESTEKLTSNMESQEKQWNQRTNELKTQYDTKLIDVEERLLEFEQKIAELNREIEICVDEKTRLETMLDQSEQKVEELNHLLREKTLALSSSGKKLSECLLKEKECSIHTQQLEEQVSQMQEVHRGYKNDRACLLACNCLLAGSLFPALAHVKELSKQRSIILKQLALCETVRQRVIQIVRSIRYEIGERQNRLENSQRLITNGSPPPILTPLLHFRKISIVVLAVNRLKKMRKQTCHLFSIDISSPNSKRHHVNVHMGQQWSKRSRLPQQQYEQQTTDIARWLRSERVLSDVRDSFSDLQSTLDTITSKQTDPRCQFPSNLRPSYHQTFIVNPTRDCFVQLLEKMSCHFHTDCESHVLSGSLCYHLGRGLERALCRGVGQHDYCSSTEVCTACCYVYGVYCVCTLCVHVKSLECTCTFL